MHKRTQTCARTNHNKDKLKDVVSVQIEMDVCVYWKQIKKLADLRV